MRILIKRSISLAFIAMAVSRDVSPVQRRNAPRSGRPRRPYQAGGTIDITRFFREKREGNKASNDGIMRSVGPHTAGSARGMALIAGTELSNLQSGLPPAA